MHRLNPTPCLNGSSATTLVDRYMRVHAILADAAGLMREAQPHGRDYQIGPGVYMDDRREFQRRLRLVAELARQYESEAYSISTQEKRHAVPPLCK